jgi:hypothetical protein
MDVLLYKSFLKDILNLPDNYAGYSQLLRQSFSTFMKAAFIKSRNIKESILALCDTLHMESFGDAG